MRDEVHGFEREHQRGGEIRDREVGKLDGEDLGVVNKWQDRRSIKNKKVDSKWQDGYSMVSIYP